MVEARIPAPHGPAIDVATGHLNRDWWRFFHDLWQRSGGVGDVTGLESTDIGVTVQGHDDDLDSIKALNTTGLAARIAADTWALRDIAAGAGIQVTDGDGVAGDPTVARSGVIVGDLDAIEVTVGQADLGGAGQKILLDAATGEQWKVRGALLSGAGTDFSGGGGDRDLAITDGTSTWSTIPAATLQSLTAARWGDTGLPFPATAAHLTAASTAGDDIVAQYSGGTADYTAGSLTIVLIVERTA